MEYIVTSLSDSGAGSLREAIAKANAYTGSEPVTITIAEGLSGEIVLESYLEIKRGLTLNGNSGSSVSIRGMEDNASLPPLQNAGPYMEYCLAASESISINDLQVNQVKLGGAASLSCENCTFTSQYPVVLSDCSGNVLSRLHFWNVEYTHTYNGRYILVTSIAGDTKFTSLGGIAGGFKMYGEVKVPEGCELITDTHLYGDLTAETGATMRLGSGLVTGTVKWTKGAMVSIKGCYFTSGTPIALKNWRGSTEEVWQVFEDCTFAAESAEVLVDAPYGSMELAALPEPFEAYRLENCSFRNGEVLTVDKGVAVCGDVRVRDGGCLALDHAIMDCMVYVHPGAEITGSGNIFTSGYGIYLVDWVGKTEDLWPDLEDSVYEDGRVHLQFYRLVGDAVFSRIPGVETVYEGSGVLVGQGQTLQVEHGAVLSGSYKVADQGALVLNGTRVEASISITTGAVLRGEDNVFAAGGVILLENWQGATADSLSCLLGTQFESSKSTVRLMSLAGDAVLSNIAGGGFSYELGWCRTTAGHTLKAESGVTVRGDIHVVADSRLVLDGARMEGSVYLAPGATFVCRGAVFTASCPLYLENWSGATESAFSALTGAVFDNGSVCVESVSGDITLSALPEGLSEYVLAMWDPVPAGTTLEIAEGVHISGGVHIADGATLRMHGAVVEAVIRLDYGAKLECSGNSFPLVNAISLVDWKGDTASVLAGLGGSDFASTSSEITLESLQGDCVLSALPGVGVAYAFHGARIVSGRNVTAEAGTTIKGDMTVEAGGTLTLDGARVCGEIRMEPGGVLQGSGNTFAESSRIVLSSWSGATADVLSGLSGTRFEGASGPCIAIGSLQGDTVLSAIQGGGVYEVGSCTVQAGQVLEVEAGTTICGSLTVQAGGTLRLNGARVQGSIKLEPGAVLEGAGNIFESPTPITFVNWSGATGNVLDQLADSTFPHTFSGFRVDSLAGDVELSSLDDGRITYYLGSECTLSEGQSLKAGVGVTIEGGLQVASGGVLQLDGACLNARLDLAADCVVRGVDVEVGPDASVYVTLENWDGFRTTCLDGVEFAAGGADGVHLYYIIDGLNGGTVRWNPATMAVPGLGGATLDTVSLYDWQDVLILPAGTELSNIRFQISNGALLQCEKGVKMTSGNTDPSMWVGDSMIDLSYGGCLKANGLVLDIPLLLSPESHVEGSVSLNGGDGRIYLRNWIGSTSYLASDVLTKATCTYAKNPCVVLDYESLAGEVELVALPKALGVYSVDWLDVEEPLVLGKNAVLSLQKWGSISIAARMECLTGSEIRAEEGVAGREIDFWGDGYMVVNGTTRFDVPILLDSPSLLQGKGTYVIGANGTFTIQLAQDAVEGDPGAWLKTMLPAKYTVENAGSYVSYLGSAAYGEEAVCFPSLDNSLLGVLTPAGFHHCVFVDIPVEKELVLADSTELYISSHIFVEESARMVCGAGSVIHGVSDYNTKRGFDVDYEDLMYADHTPRCFVQGVLQADSTLFDITLGLGSHARVSGSCTLGAQQALCFVLDEWDGSAGALRSLLEGLDYTVLHEDAYCVFEAFGTTADITINNALLAAMCPAGVNGIRFGELVCMAGADGAARSITVEEGTELWVGGIVVSAGGRMSIAPDVVLRSSFGDTARGLYVQVAEGELAMEGVDLSGAHVSVGNGGGLEMKRCSHIGSLSINASENIRISNCDFSTTEYIVVEDCGMPIDFSGNYWGTTDLDAILSKFQGYTDSVIINNVLPAPGVETPPLRLDAGMREENNLNEDSLGITLLFNNGIDATSVTSGSVRMVDASGNDVPLKLEVRDKRIILRWNVLPEGEYRVLLSADLRDITGQTLGTGKQLKYTCGVGAFTWDSLIEARKVKIGADGEVVLYFSHKLDASTVDASSIRMVDASGNAVLLQGMVCNGNVVTLRFAGLADGVYKIEVSDTLRDVYGKAFEAGTAPSYICSDSDFAFAEDMSMRNILSEGESVITLSFNSTIDAATATPENIRLVDAHGAEVPVSAIRCDGTSMTLRVDSLPLGAYHVEISPRLADTAGVPFNGDGEVYYYVREQDSAKVLMWDCRNTIVNQCHYVDIYFDRDMDATSITKDSVHFIDPSGRELGVSLIGSGRNTGNTFYRVYFDAPMECGDYTFRLDDSIRGADGRKLVTGTEHKVSVSAPDIAVESVTVDAVARAGLSTVVSWDVRNLGASLNSVSWTDTVYLCKTPEWNPAEAVVLGRVTHKKQTLGQGATLASQLKVQWDGLLDGDYFIFVVADESGNLSETDSANNLSPARKVSLTVPELVPGVAAQTTVASLNETLYYSFVAQESGTLRIDADSMGIQGAWNALPTEGNAIGKIKDGAYYMDVIAGEKYYLAIRPKNVGQVTVSAESAPLTVGSIVALPTECGIQVWIQGAGFTAETRFCLEDQEGNRYDTSGREVTGSMNASILFDLPEDLPLGTKLTLKAYYESSPESVVASGSLLDLKDIMAYDGEASLSFNYAMYPEFYRAGFWINASFVVANKKSCDIYSPLVLVYATSSMQFSYTAGASEQARRSLLFLPGENCVLREGMALNLPVCAMTWPEEGNLVWDGCIVVNTLSPSDTSVISDIQWEYYASALQPDGMVDAEWRAWWDDMRPRIGTTVADFVSFVRAMRAFIGYNEWDDTVGGLAGITQKVMQSPTPFVPAQVVAGKLLDSEGRGIEDAVISVYRVNGEERVLVGSTMTDANGAYKLGKLQVGGIYELESSTAFVRDGAKTTTLALGTISGDIRGLDLRAPEFVATVSVRLTGLTGGGYPDAVVYLESAGGERVYLNVDNGVWTADNVVAGDYTLHVESAGYATVADAVVVARTADNNFSAKMVSLCSVEGKLLQPDGVGAAAGETLALVQDGRVVAVAETAEDGSYSFAGVEAGTYSIRMWDGVTMLQEGVEVRAGVGAVSLPDIVRESAHFVTGVVPGVPAGIAVELRSADGAVYTAQVDAEGGFRMEGVAEGTYRLYVAGVELEPGYSLQCGKGGEPLDIGSHAWLQTARIAGSLQADGAGVAGWVGLYQGSKLVASTQTTDSGHYEFAVLKTGDYELRALGSQGGTGRAVQVSVQSMSDAICQNLAMGTGSFLLADAIAGGLGEDASATLYWNIDGELVLVGGSGDILGAGGVCSNLSPGAYVLEVTGGEGVSRAEFTVEEGGCTNVALPPFTRNVEVDLHVELEGGVAEGALVYVPLVQFC